MIQSCSSTKPAGPGVAARLVPAQPQRLGSIHSGDTCRPCSQAVNSTFDLGTSAAARVSIRGEARTAGFCSSTVMAVTAVADRLNACGTTAGRRPGRRAARRRPRPTPRPDPAGPPGRGERRRVAGPALGEQRAVQPEQPGPGALGPDVQAKHGRRAHRPPRPGAGGSPAPRPAAAGFTGRPPRASRVHRPLISRSAATRVSPRRHRPAGA